MELTGRNGTPTWRSSRHFVLRLAGFPINLCEGFRHGDSLEQADTLVRASVEALSARTIPPRFQAAFDMDLLRARERLATVVAGDRFQEAVFLSSREAAARMAALARDPVPRCANSERARRERLATLYLQRFCVKNESASFFGPTRYGVFRDTDSPALSGDARGTLSKRRLFFSHWAAVLIEAAVAKGRSGIDASKSRIPANTWEPLAFLDVGEDGRDPTMLEELAQVQTLLGLWPQLADGGERRQTMVAISAHFTRITGVEARRAPGGLYGDREVVHEDCEYDMPGLSIGTTLRDGIVHECAAVLDAMVLPAEWRFHGLREAFHQWALTTIGANQSWPVVKVAQALATCPDVVTGMVRHAHDAVTRHCEPVLAYLRACSTPVTASPELSFSDDQLRTLAGLVSAARPAVDWPMILSPDVLIDAASVDAINQGHYRVIVGELHSSLSVNGFYAAMLDDPDALRSDLEQRLCQIGRGMAPVNFVVPHANKTYAAVDLAFPDIEYAGGVARPGKPVLRLRDLYVRCDASGTWLHSASGSSPLFIYNKLPQLLGLMPLALFTYPLATERHLRRLWFDAQPHAPRIVAGRHVLYRERWVLTAGMVQAAVGTGSAAEQFLRLRALCRDHRLPGMVFVSLPGERKPLHVDFDSWLLTAPCVQRIRALPAHATLSLTEMLPGPDRLWLHDTAGRRTSEIRFTLFR
jgi:hypothetical protein